MIDVKTSNDEKYEEYKNVPIHFIPKPFLVVDDAGESKEKDGDEE